jgi:hypothetical protein
MKIKLKSFFVAVCFILCTGEIALSQGIYTPTDNSEDGSGSLRDDRPPLSGGGGPEAPGGDADPVGEGILILSVLAGGYTFVKKRKISKRGGYEA